jgi:hypothetical protein
MSYINNNWKGIAKGHTAFCILGGPSTNQVKDIQSIIDNNFTVTVNHNIKTYPNCDMYITADNSIAREYFEDKELLTIRCLPILDSLTGIIKLKLILIHDKVEKKTLKIEDESSIDIESDIDLDEESESETDMEKHRNKYWKN